MEKARVVFYLTVIEQAGDITLIGDGQERFRVREEGLDELIEPVNCNSDAGCDAYDAWCGRWAIPE